MTIGSTAAAPASATWIRRLRQAATDYDWAAVAAIVQEYLTDLGGRSGRVPVHEWRPMLTTLREHRRFDHLLAVADALLARDVDDPLVRAHLAQALVDQGRPAAAELIYASIVVDHARAGTDGPARPASAYGLAEARGGIGRCAKEMFLRAADPKRRIALLGKAYRAYREAYDEDHDLYWHGINAASLLRRAAREGYVLVEQDGADATGSEARRIAEQVLQTAGAQSEATMWSQATACEACVVLGLDADAMEWARLVADDPDASAFGLAALLRQLTEVCQLDTTHSPGDLILPLLRSTLLAHQGGEVTVPAEQLRSRRAHTDDPELERVFGDTRFQSLAWYRSGLVRCRAVAWIGSEFGDGIGTGFLIAGPDLHHALPELVLVTNAHVVHNEASAAAARVVFQGLEGNARDRTFGIERLIWTDPVAGLDTSVLALAEYPPDVEPLPLAATLPKQGGAIGPRAYLIGHPRGVENPQFSLQDNAILDFDDTFLHYRSPTEPGSSGSPVFDGTWRVIGLHHAGREDTPRLNGKAGTYAANEAILLSAIKAALVERPPVTGGRR